MKLPNSLYVRVSYDDKPWLHAAEAMAGLDLDVGERGKIGLYKLVGVHEVQGVIKASKLLPVGNRNSRPHRP